MAVSQSAQTVLMIRPSSFGYDTETALTNAFQNLPTAAAEAIQLQAAAEFQAYIECLHAQDIDTIIIDDQPHPPKPNGVFPNNWLTTTADGRVYLYPMATPSRRVERDPAILSRLAETHHVAAIHDLSEAEAREEFLESTGVIVFDHPNKLAYACISPRCHEDLFVRHAAEIGYTPVAFRGFVNGLPLYHTNLMLGIQSTTAVICSAVITDPAERERVIQSLRTTGHEVVDITVDQLAQYCGNILEVQNRQGQPYLLLSVSAHAAFTPQQLKILSRDKTLLPVALPTIQAVGGGSARCMVAEIFLPPRVLY